MDRLDALKLFLRTAELGSFSAAGRENGYAQSQVSRAIKALEAEFGITLLNRSTRAVSLTAEGERVIAHIRDANEALERAREEAGADHPVGILRVTASVGYGHAVIAPVVHQYLDRYPDASAALDLLDSFVDLTTSGHDVAVRIGHVEGRTLRIVGLGTCPMRIVASPKWISAHPSLIEPADLETHSCLPYASWQTPSRWTLNWQGKEPARHRQQSVVVNGRLSSTHLPTLRESVVSGLGIANLPAWLVDTDLEAGRLIEVFSDWRPSPQPIHAVLPPGQHTPQRARLFIELLKAAIQANAKPLC